MIGHFINLTFCQTAKQLFLMMAVGLSWCWLKGGRYPEDDRPDQVA